MIQTYLRVKSAPPKDEQHPDTFGFLTILNDSEILLESPEDSHAFRVSKARTSERVQFSRILKPTASQLDVFAETCAPLLMDSLLSQHDSLLFTLGVSGAGKTFTLFGPPDRPGVAYITMGALFHAIRDREASFPVAESLRSRLDKCKILEASKYLADKHQNATFALPPASFYDTFSFDVVDHSYQYAVYLSFAEIYNDRIFDLLEKASFFGHRRALNLKKSATSDKKAVNGIQKVFVGNVAEACRLIAVALQLRKSTSTKSNAVSSRSHLVLCAELYQLQPKTGEISSCEINLVDLAGSERTRSAETSGLLLREGASINKSLLALGQCLEALRRKHDGKQHVVPFRQSKLTELLFHSGHLTGTARTSMLVNIDPLGSFDENAQVMRYSANAREIMLPPVPVEMGNGHMDSASATPRAGTPLGSPAPHSASRPPSVNVAALMAQLEAVQLENKRLRELLAEADSEMVNLEYVVREQMTTEMESRVREVERIFLDRLCEESVQGLEYTDHKLDMMAKWMRQLQEDNAFKDEKIAELEKLLSETQDQVEEQGAEAARLAQQLQRQHQEATRRSSRKLSYEDQQAIREAHTLRTKRKLWPEKAVLEEDGMELSDDTEVLSISAPPPPKPVLMPRNEDVPMDL